MYKIRHVSKLQTGLGKYSWQGTSIWIEKSRLSYYMPVLEEDVVRGEAAVDDAARVRVPQRGAQLPRHLHLVIHRHIPGRGGG